MILDPGPFNFILYEEPTQTVMFFFSQLSNKVLIYAENVIFNDVTLTSHSKCSDKTRWPTWTVLCSQFSSVYCGQKISECDMLWQRYAN